MCQLQHAHRANNKMEEKTSFTRVWETLLRRGKGCSDSKRLNAFLLYHTALQAFAICQAVRKRLWIQIPVLR